MTFIASFLKRLWNTDRPLTAVGAAMSGLLVLTLIALAIDPRQITGAPAWLKPAKFAASIAIYTLTLAWVFTFLPDWPRMRRAVSRISSIVFLIEIAIIDLQAWRGTTSHFNTSTLFDGALFTIMGLAIVVQTFSAVAVAWALWRQKTFSDPAMGWALRLGMAITIVGAFSGGLMTRPTQAQLDQARLTKQIPVSGAHTVGAPDGGPGLAGTGWSLEHGDLRIAHFVGLHSLQIVPILAVAFRRFGVPLSKRIRLVWTAACSHFALYGLLLWQALRGQSIAAPDAVTVTAIALWAVLTAVAGWKSLSDPDPARIPAAIV